MAADLPTDFDIVVLGTGLPESIIAAAFSRNGYKVLHLDRNPYYSSSWASFSLASLEGWIKSYENCADKKPEGDFSDLLKEHEMLVSIPTQAQDVSNIKTQYHVSESLPTVLETVAQETIPCDTQSAQESSSSQESQLSVQNTQKEKPASESEVGGAGDTVPTKGEQDLSSQTNNHFESQEIDEKENTERKQGVDVLEDSENKLEVDVVGGNLKKDHCEASSSDSVADVSKAADLSVGKSSEEKQEQITQNESTLVASHGKETTETQQKHEKKIWSMSDIKKEWRKFNLDLAPKILFSTSQTVDLLISSDVAKYCEFRTVSRVLTFLKGELEKVPCSRADVFSNKKVSVLEKRMLMKFMTSCAQSNEHPEFYEDFKEKPFCDFLKAKKLSPTILHFVQHSIAMVTDAVSTEEAIKKMKQFMVSLGRYGNTAFLFPLYGSGELPQAFCRLCAVFGGTYCLQTSASALVIHENRCCAVITTEGQRIECKHVVLGPTYSPKEFIHTDRSFISRGILLTDKSILHEETSELSLLNLIPEKAVGSQDPVTVLELPSSSMVCPKDMNVIHMTRFGTSDAESDLANTVNILFSNEEADQSKPSILWSLYFTQEDFSSIKTTEKKPDNVYIMPGPGTELDMDSVVEQARQVWESVCPDEEFLPKPPNPEDIIYVDNEETKVGEEGTGCLEADVGQADHDIANTTSTETGSDHTVAEQTEHDCGGSSDVSKSQEMQTSSLQEHNNKDSQQNDEK